ncbi:hypothetical protein B0H13DRAFT_2346053 [Mycena leptocephala]|nr:hypothetical protein B0H13DRAFT_2346053 [Mycena leptocephala]
MSSLATLALVLLRVADTAVQTAIAADTLRAVALLLEKGRVNAVMESIAEDVERLVAMVETVPRSSSMGPKGADDGLAEELRTAAEVLTRTVEDQCGDITSDIRSYLGLAATKHDKKWNEIRGTVRRFIDAGMLDLTVGWKEQESRRFMKVYDADAHCELKRFRGQWVAQFLIHGCFGGRKTYKTCINKEGTYRARAREGCTSRLERELLMIRDSDDENPFPTFHKGKGTGPRAPSHSPNSSPLSSPNRNNGSRTRQTSPADSIPQLSDREND